MTIKTNKISYYFVYANEVVFFEWQNKWKSSFFSSDQSQGKAVVVVVFAY